MSCWRQKVAMVTGASSGLGLHLALALAGHQARVVLVGRNQARLEAAARKLSSQGAGEDDLLTFSADVTQPEEVDRLFEAAADRFGRLDLLVNCAGKSMRGLASQVPPTVFLELFDLNALAAIRCCQRSIPQLRKTKGTIINIGSLASRIATPKLGAYPASKFALAAYSEQLRRELKVDGIHVLSVFPGPIAREDAGERYAIQAADLGDDAARPGGSRLSAVDPGQLSARILDAARRRKPELMPLKARLFCSLALCFPSWGDWIVRRMTE